MGEEIILQQFKSWTAGLSPKDARRSVFSHIRDIPYAIIPELRDPVRGPEGILRLNKGSCQPKHYLLFTLFNKLNLPVKLVTYSFKWADSAVRYPDELKKLIPQLPTTYHLACKACIENKWVLIDATYDLALKKVNFPVNEDWDGLSDTQNAVTPIEEIIHANAEERVSFESSKRALYTVKDKELYAEFIDKFNSWLEIVRK